MFHLKFNADEVLTAIETKSVLNKQHYLKTTLPLDAALLQKESQLWDLWIPLAAQPEI